MENSSGFLSLGDGNDCLDLGFSPRAGDELLGATFDEKSR
jgi:hypothetical protein